MGEGVTAALEAAKRCLLAYDSPTWKEKGCQLYSETVDGVQHIAFAGTKNIKDILNDLSATPVSRQGLGDLFNGFADAWEPWRDYGQEVLTGGPVILEGHSLGGMLAQITASYLHRHGVPVLEVQTFGCPRGWGHIGAALYEERNIPTLNWKNGHDAVFGRPLWGVGVGQVAACDGEPVEPRWKSYLHPIRRWENHRLEGRYGYLKALGGTA